VLKYGECALFRLLLLLKLKLWSFIETWIGETLLKLELVKTLLKLESTSLYWDFVETRAGETTTCKLEYYFFSL